VVRRRARQAARQERRRIGLSLPEQLLDYDPGRRWPETTYQVLAGASPARFVLDGCSPKTSKGGGARLALKRYFLRPVACAAQKRARRTLSYRKSSSAPLWARTTGSARPARLKRGARTRAHACCDGRARLSREVNAPTEPPVSPPRCSAPYALGGQARGGQWPAATPSWAGELPRGPL